MAEALAYFDSSVLAKRYLEEPGSRHARRLMQRYRLLSSVFAPVEVLSAISRRYRTGELSRSQFDVIVTRLQAEQAGWDLVEIAPQVVKGAQWLVQNQPVRMLDALHISSALIIQREHAAALPFATADQRQREAAASAGLHVLWVAASDRPRVRVSLRPAAAALPSEWLILADAAMCKRGVFAGPRQAGAARAR